MREQAVKDLGELIANPPWGGGGKYPAGAKLLQNISPTSELWSQKGRKRLNDWKRKGAAHPHVVADILLGIKLDGKTGTVAAFELSEAVSTSYSFDFSFRDDFKLGVFLLSALLKIGYYGLRRDYTRNTYVVFLHKKAIAEFVEYDPYTKHTPFPRWDAPRDLLGKWLIKPSFPQFKSTVWKPSKDHFKGQGNPWLQPATTELYLMDDAPNVWVHAVNHLESTSYTINQEVLGIVNTLPTPPQRDPAYEREFKELKEERITSNIGDLDALVKEKTPLTPAQDTLRKDYYQRWYRCVLIREKLKSAHSLHVRVAKRAKELGTRPFWNRAFVDYRGRMYLSKSVVNYQTGDMSRGLIQFAEGRRVRKKDMRYLWIHIATAWGQKGDVIDRETWAKKHQKEWLRYARKPVETHDEWKEAGDKWVFIRACLELRTLLKDPKHKSQLIVEIDQSMSALQHIAMILGDEEMAEQVNLTATYHDLYTEVGNTTDALKDLPEELKRKIVKWAVVPWVYGGNEWSAFEDYSKRREDVAFFKKKTPTQLYAVAADVVRNLERTLDKFEVYKNLLRDYGEQHLKRERGKNKPDHIKWTTPSFFEVHHYKQVAKPYQLEIQSYTPVSGGVFLEVDKDGKERPPRIAASEPIEIGKKGYGVMSEDMLKAMAPNFLHSHDSALAQYVLIQAFERDIPCVTVHDAFGIHLRNVGEVKPLFISAFRFMYHFFGSPLFELEAPYGRGERKGKKRLEALTKKGIKSVKADYQNKLWGSSEYVDKYTPHALT